MIVTAGNRFDVAWAEEKSGLHFRPPYSAIVCSDGHSPKAVAIFQNWTGPDVEITIAADLLPRRFLRAVRQYVVNQLGCHRATFKTKPSNMAALKAMSRLNALCEGRQVRYYADGSDALIFAIHDQDYAHG